jgi:hypothetical protein
MIDAWRPNRDAEGWRTNTLPSAPTPSSPPELVTPVPRLVDDLRALSSLFSSPEPPLRFIHSNAILETVYGFSDASGAGFGSTFTHGQDVHYCHGIWIDDEAMETSNYRELANLVNTLETGHNSGHFKHAEVWIFTDNTTAEGVFWRGHSPSRKLNELALRLRVLEMHGDIRINMIHVPGSRMIAQGTNGLSRGDLTEGVMAGDNMTRHFPLRFLALERQPSVLQWLQSWIPGGTLTQLSIADWFDKGHGILGWATNASGWATPIECSSQWLLWSPLPALAEVLLDELDESRHKHKHLNHIIILPRLMTFAWRKRLKKLCDLVFELPPGARSCWPSTEHEPLIVGLTLHFSSSSPWQVKRATDVLALEWTVRAVWSAPDGDERTLLHEFCISPERLDSMPPGVVR